MIGLEKYDQSPEDYYSPRGSVKNIENIFISTPGTLIKSYFSAVPFHITHPPLPILVYLSSIDSPLDLGVFQYIKAVFVQVYKSIVTVWRKSEVGLTSIRHTFSRIYSVPTCFLSLS